MNAWAMVFSCGALLFVALEQEGVGCLGPSLSNGVMVLVVRGLLVPRKTLWRPEDALYGVMDAIP